MLNLGRSRTPLMSPRRGAALRTATALAALVMQAAAATAGAQSPTVHGVVRDSASREPIAGAVITVLDSAGQVASNAIAGADGRFRFVRPADAARLRARRIGFRPREIPLPDRARGDTAALEIVMDRLPQILARVRVSESAHCPGSPEASAAAQLWAQARDGLLASIVAREANPARAEMLTFERAHGSRGEGIVRHRHRIGAGRTARAFQATASAAEFAERGYVQDDRDGRTFNAPDADVLLHESFAATHCFRLVDGTGEHADQVGLAFAPARNRRGIVDVEGTLWLDRLRPALRLLEFRYTNLDRLSMAAGAGGMIAFNTMENGIVLITRWTLRMPVFAMERRPPTLAERLDARSSGGVRTLVEIAETGGMVVSAQWPDGVRWTQPIAALNGMVVERSSRQPIANALVTFSGAWDTVTTDTAGRFSMPIVLGGRFDFAALDTSFGSHLNRRLVRRLVEVPDQGASGMIFELPSSAESVGRLCASAQMPAGSSILLGRIRRTDGAAPGKVEVRASWQVVITEGSGGIRVLEPRQTAEPDADGRFQLCGVVRDRPIAIAVWRDGSVVADTTVFVRAGVAGQIDVLIPPSDPMTAVSTHDRSRTPTSNGTATTKGPRESPFRPLTSPI